jgi:membrane-bound lytic murein transglycosylase D
MPDIPVEDDPRVERVLEYYSESPVGRETFQAMLFRCGAYRDMIQATLIRHGMPSDVMAVVFAESGCEPRAKSPVGAKGLWQFMPEAGRAYHLRVIEDKVDERQSPPKSTEAAIKFLSDLHAKLGSWDLVFASYNMGPFGLIARIERAGGDVGFWDLVDADLLPDETANYVPTIQAMALILANLQKFKFTGVQMRSPQLTADLEAPPGTRLGMVARAAATSVIDIRSLNLDILGDTVPDVPGGRFAVQVRKEVVWQARDALKGLLDTGDNADLCVNPTFDWGKQRFTPEMQEACKRRGPALEPSPQE